MAECGTCWREGGRVFGFVDGGFGRSHVLFRDQVVDGFLLHCGQG